MLTLAKFQRMLNLINLNGISDANTGPNTTHLQDKAQPELMPNFC